MNITADAVKQLRERTGAGRKRAMANGVKFGRKRKLSRHFGNLSAALACSYEREGKRGLGTAYVTGFRWALERGYDYVFEMDADLSHDPAHLKDFLKAVAEADAQVKGKVGIVSGGGRSSGVFMGVEFEKYNNHALRCAHPQTQSADFAAACR